MNSHRSSSASSAVSRPAVTHRAAIRAAMSAGALAALGLALSAGVASANPVIGAWDPPFTLPVEMIHSIHLPTGKILTWDYNTGANVAKTYLIDQNTMAVTQGLSLTGLFCSGHAGLADGRILVSGGTGKADETAIFDPQTETWTKVSRMFTRRFYPTLTTLADGRVASFGGAAGLAGVPEIYDVGSNTWTPLVKSPRAPKTYPRGFLLPDGRLGYFHFGPSALTPSIFDPATQVWSFLATEPFVTGPAVMFEPGKVMIAGTDPTPATTQNADTRVIDFNVDPPEIRKTPRMTYARSKNNLTILPDGTVLATGGRGERSAGVYTAELWDPATETWSTLATTQVPIRREYHSTAILLRDGRVLQGGGEPKIKNAEVFHPPYLFKGPRPVVTAAPSTVIYGGTFAVTTPDAATVVKVALLRLGAATHAMDMNQRYIPLSFTAGPGSLTVDAPAGALIAPPGDYMLFLIAPDGVPSIAEYVRVAVS